MKKVYLYKISQNVNNDYDTYDCAVVAAHSEDEARNIHPGYGYVGGLCGLGANQKM